MTVVVEAGGAFDIAEAGSVRTIVAEDGAIVDFTGFSGSAHTIAFFYGPETVVLGSIPTVYLPTPLGGEYQSIGERLPPIRVSYGVGTFAVGYTVDLQIDGPGSVSVVPAKDYYQFDETVSFTATADPNAFFIRWIGALSGHETNGTIRVRGNTSEIARFSTAPNYFTVWRLEHFTREELANVEISGFDADPDHDDISNAAEYAFGTDPRLAGGGGHDVEVAMASVDGELKVYARYLRPGASLDVAYTVLVSSDLTAWNANGDGTGVTYSREVGVETIDNTYERVALELFPDGGSPGTVFVRISADLFD